MLANGQEAQLNGATDGGGNHKRARLTRTGSSVDQDDTSSSDEEEDQSPRSHKRRASILSSHQQHQHQQHQQQQHQRSAPVKPEERLAVDDAENPLQLLARASNLHLSPESSHGQSPGTAVSLPVTGVSGGGGVAAAAGVSGGGVGAAAAGEEMDPEMRQVEAFFGTTHFNVDRGEDYDPVELGLVTEEEAEMLFDL